MGFKEEWKKAGEQAKENRAQVRNKQSQKSEQETFYKNANTIVKWGALYYALPALLFIGIAIIFFIAWLF